MNQFFYTLSFCLKHFSYLFVLALPLITLEFAVSYLVLQLDLNENMSNDLIIESIQPVAIQLAVLGIVSMVLSIAFYGAMMVAFEALSSNQDLSINQAYLMGLRKFFPLLWSSIAASIVYGLGLLLLVLPGFYLFARLGMYPAYIMFQNKRAFESLGLAWNDSDKEGTKLFLITSVFIGLQLVIGLIFGFLAIDTNMVAILVLALVKYFTLIPLFYLFYSLYKSLHPNNI